MEISSSQQGSSSIKMIAIIVTCAFYLLLAFKIIPVYAENRFIVTAIKSIAVDSEALRGMTKKEIRSTLYRYYTLNNVRSPGSREVKIIRNSKSVVIQNKYEVRIPIIGNIDIVVSFNNVLDSARFDECCEGLPEEEK